MATFYKPNEKRHKIVMLESEFNSDILASESWIDVHGKTSKDSLLLAKISDRDPNVAVSNVV
jgi:kynureninase